ncbi:F-box protein At5g07610-like, partial [Bidens hawaiensis]|uniref:F-box protein At5g07610-like n=1 Tax=Bidens hawaiensis TaxID=980011 RepID=UPI0040499C24
KIKKSQKPLDNEAESTHSGPIVGSNDDLLTEILRRIPVTAVLRFKSVSKHWQSLLGHQRFTFLYDNVQVSHGLFLRDLYIPFDVENPTPPPFRSLNFYPDRSGIKIVQSCNGLLLCCSNRGKEHTRKYYVFNPTTKQFAIIPSIIGGSGASRTIRFIGLAFHRADCVHYKVVCIRNVKRYENTFQIQAYSSDTGNWRILQESIYASDFTSFSYEVNYGVYWNGAVHWIPYGCNLVYFKLDVEQLKTMLLPKRPSWFDGERQHYFREFGAHQDLVEIEDEMEEMPSWSDGARQHYFGESRGQLHLVEDARNENPLHLNVYEMLSNYSGWIVKYQVELDDLPTSYPYTVYESHGPSEYQFGVVDVVRGKEEESTFMVVRTREKIIKYNVLNKSFKPLFELPSLCQRYSCNDFHRYTQFLSSF